MLPAGKSLRTLREKLGLTMRDVENSSARVADKYRNDEFSIPPSRLSPQMLNGDRTPTSRQYTAPTFACDIGAEVPRPMERRLSRLRVIS